MALCVRSLGKWPGRKNEQLLWTWIRALETSSTETFWCSMLARPQMTFEPGTFCWTMAAWPASFETTARHWVMCPVKSALRTSEDRRAEPRPEGGEERRRSGRQASSHVRDRRLSNRAIFFMGTTRISNARSKGTTQKLLRTPQIVGLWRAVSET